MGSTASHHETYLELLIPDEAIQEKIREIGKALDAEYAGKELVLVMILKGSICLVADLIRVLQVPNHIETVQCFSYGAGGSVRGRLRVEGLEKIDVQDKHVLIVDDIFDSGHPLLEVFSRFQQKQPASL